VALKARQIAIKIEREKLPEHGKEVSSDEIAKRIAERKISLAIIATLSIAGKPYQWRHKYSNKWFWKDADEWDVGLFATGFFWHNGNQPRTLLYNVTVPMVKKTISLCLFNATPDNLDEINSGSYIALGELKGGIDPAGADEHWKTAKTALERIRKSFSRAKQNPHTFFIGAAIERKMANEIWDELQQGVLSNAANLNNENQLASISHWLCNL
jgi:hypothetical protein